MKFVAAALVFAAACTAADGEHMSTDSAELNGGASAPMPYRTWTPSVSNYWVGSSNNTTIILYEVKGTGDSFAWGIGDGNQVGYVYKLQNVQRAAFIQAASISLQVMAKPGDESSWVIQGAAGGNPPTPTPGVAEFSVAAVNRIVRTAGTNVDAVNATQNFR